MNITTYILGSAYIMMSIFRLSNNFTTYLFNNDIINLPLSKYEKINECIYSSIHGVIVTAMASISTLYMNTTIFNYNPNIIEKDNSLQYFTISFCLSYFIFDLLKCLYYQKYLFILHHLAAINLLILTIYSFYNNENKGFYAIYLIFLLESNTILLNIGFLLKEFKFHYSITCTMWIIHLFFFNLFRIITLPRILFIYFYNEQWTLINIYKLPSFILIYTGSVYWSYRQTIGIHKYLKENCVI